MSSPRPRRSRAARRALDVLGGTLLAIGAVNAFIPGLPTTVFWIGPAIKAFLRWRPFRKRRQH